LRELCDAAMYAAAEMHRMPIRMVLVFWPRDYLVQTYN
jgi:hypothetical protein